MKKNTKILLSVLAISNFIIFFSLPILAIIRNIDKLDVIMKDIKSISFIILLFILSITFLMFYLLLLNKKSKFSFSTLFLINTILLLLTLIPDITFKLIGIKDSDKWFKFTNENNSIWLIQLPYWYGMLLYLISVANIGVGILLMLKFRRIKNKKTKAKKLSKQIQEEKQEKNLTTIKQEAMDLQKNLNSNTDDYNEIDIDAQKDKFINPQVITEEIENNSGDNNDPKEDYDELLAKLKNKNDEMETSQLTKENIIIPNKEVQTNNFHNKEIAKIKVYLPKNGRYKNIDINKLREKIYYENRERKTFDLIKSQELQKKYSNKINLGEADKIWNITKNKKREDLINKTKTDETDKFTSDELEDYLKHQAEKKIEK